MKESWQTLRAAIPERSCATVARHLRLNPDYVSRWVQRPFSDEAPLANGKRSILDRMDDLMGAIFLVNPLGPALIIDHLQSNYDELREASLDPEYWDRREHAALTLQEVVDAVRCLNLDASDDETLRELFEAREAIETAIKRVRNPRGSRSGCPARGEGHDSGASRVPSGEKD